jgi:serine/threonine protein kinase
LNTSLLLTYCFEVGSGLHYLSSRRVVHRDIAARNVRTSRSTATCGVGGDVPV